MYSNYNYFCLFIYYFYLKIKILTKILTKKCLIKSYIIPDEGLINFVNEHLLFTILLLYQTLRVKKSSMVKKNILFAFLLELFNLTGQKKMF